MKQKNRKTLWTSLWLLGSFLLWTLALRFVDVRPIGPGQSRVGFGALNQSIHNLTGVNMALYTLTDWLGLVPLAFAAGFALLGLLQWLRRKKLRRVDTSLLILGGFYLAVIALYLFFEGVVINCRPVRIEGVLEASYPSSTTVLTICVMSTARLELNARLRKPALRRFASLAIALFTLFMVTARLLSGVHWFSDIVGGILLSAGLVEAYAALTGQTR